MPPETEGAGGTGANDGAGGAAGAKETGGGAGAADWRATFIPPELADHPSLKDYKEPQALVRSHVEQNALLGRKGLILPKEDAPPEEWGKVYEALGRPKDPAGYGFAAGEGQDPEFVAWGAELMHGAGLSKAQATRIFEAFTARGNEYAARDAEARRAAYEKAEGALREQWGAEFAANVEHANRAIKQFGGDEALGVLREAGVANDPRILGMFHAIGKGLGEDAGRGMEGGGGGGMTAAQAKAKLAELGKDPDWTAALRDRRHPKHGEANEESNRLIEIAEGIRRA